VISAHFRSKSFVICCLFEISKYKSKGLKCVLFSKLCIMTSFSFIWLCLVLSVWFVVPVLWYCLFCCLWWVLFGIVFGLCCFGVLLGLLLGFFWVGLFCLVFLRGW